VNAAACQDLAGLVTQQQAAAKSAQWAHLGSLKQAYSHAFPAALASPHHKVQSTPWTATLLTNAQLACGFLLAASVIHLPLKQSAYAGLAMEVGVFVVQQWMIK
jgi:hypothetical protein